MKKSIAALALALTLTVFIPAIPVRAAPAVLNVGPGQPFPLISAALGVALAGDVIHVWNNPGIPYIENPQILPHLSNIQIIGQSIAGVTIQAAAPGACFAVWAAGVTIVNLQIVCPVIAPGTWGVYLFPTATQCRILNNQILNFDCGIVIDNSQSHTIIGNDISNCMVTQGPPPQCSTAIYMFGASTNNIIRGNELALSGPNWYSVGTNGASGNIITYNNFWVPVNVPQAYVALGDLNIWDDGVRKGNFWNDPAPKPPYIIDPNNFDKWCSPGPYNWAAMSFDINRDLKCDIKDIAPTAAAYGTTWSTLKWNPIVDVVADAKIDIKDIAFVAKMYGWVSP